MKKNTPKINQGYDNMDDLISRKAAMKALPVYHPLHTQKHKVPRFKNQKCRKGN